MNIYTLPRVPGATETQKWTSFCHQKESFVVIGYEEFRDTSRWKHVERKRKFRVDVHGRRKSGALGTMPLGYFSTLERAQKEAQEWVEYSERLAQEQAGGANNVR